MEGQAPFDPQAVIREFRAAGDIPLPKTKVLHFIATATPDNLRDLATWHQAGSKIPNTPGTPVSLFSEALEEGFDELSAIEKERVLANGLRFVFSDTPRGSASYTAHPYRNYEGRPAVRYVRELFLFSQGGVMSQEGLIYTKNIAAYLSKVLEYTGGDLKAAEELLARIPYVGNDTTRQSVGIVTNFLYRSSQILHDPHRPKIKKSAASIRQDFQRRHVKNRALAFWVDAHLGTFDIRRKNGDLRLREVLSEDYPPLKTEIFAYLREQLLTDPPGYGGKHALIAKVAKEQEALYKAVRKRHPSAQFVEEYEMVQRLLKLRKLESKTQGGEIAPNDLGILLSTYPQLIGLVSEQELKSALDNASDSNTIKALEEAFRLKRASALGQSLQI